MLCRGLRMCKQAMMLLQVGPLRLTGSGSGRRLSAADSGGDTVTDVTRSDSGSRLSLPALAVPVQLTQTPSLSDVYTSCAENPVSADPPSGPLLRLRVARRRAAPAAARRLAGPVTVTVTWPRPTVACLLPAVAEPSGFRAGPGRSVR
jgi:hypothetical protein